MRDTEKYLLPNEKKRLTEETKFGKFGHLVPKNEKELEQLIKDAPKIKAVKKDTTDLYNKVPGKYSSPLEELMYEKPYDAAYKAGYEGLRAPKNPFKKDTLAYWFFEDLYTQGKSDN